MHTSSSSNFRLISLTQYPRLHNVITRFLAETVNRGIIKNVTYHLWV